MRRTPHLAAWILCALSCALPRAEEGTTSGPASTGAKPAEGVELIVDYLPPALYETEPLTACFRVENHAKIPATVRVRAEVRLEDGAWKLRDESKLEIASGARQTYQKDLDLAGAKAVRYVLKTGAGELPGPAVRLVRDEIPWPESTAKDGRLVDGEGAALLLVTRRRLNREDRRWAPLRWAVSDKKGETVKRVLVLAPGAWAAKAEGGGTEDLSALLPEGFAEPHAAAALGPYPLDGTPPILKALAGAAGALGDPPPERVVVLLPPEDLEVATDPRVYRIVVEALLGRLRAGGVREVALAPPCFYGRPKRQQQRLWDEVREAAKLSEATALDVSDWLDESRWRVDPEQEGVYGRAPNALGLKKIAQKLAELLP